MNKSLSLCLGLLSQSFTPLLAAPITITSLLGYEYRDQRLASTNPDLERPDHLNAFFGRSIARQEEARLAWQAQGGAIQGLSPDGSFVSLDASAQASYKQKFARDTLEASWLRAHGVDATSRPLEESFAGQGSAFTGTSLNYNRLQQLSLKDSLGFTYGLSRNIQNQSDTRSTLLLANWARLLTEDWSHVLSLSRQRSEERGAPLPPSLSYQVDSLQNLALTKNLSFQANAGVLRQELGSESTQSLSFGLAFAYLWQRAEPLSENPETHFAQDNLIERPELDQQLSIRLQSQLVAGFVRGLDARRSGGRSYRADQYYLTGVWAIDREQSLEMQLRRSQSLEKQIDALAEIEALYAALEYRWAQPLQYGRWKGQGIFSIGMTQERLSQDPSQISRDTMTARVTLGF